MFTINGVLDISTGKNKDDLAEKIFYSIKILIISLIEI